MTILPHGITSLFGSQGSHGAEGRKWPYGPQGSHGPKGSNGREGPYGPKASHGPTSSLALNAPIEAPMKATQLLAVQEEPGLDADPCYPGPFELSSLVCIGSATARPRFAMSVEPLGSTAPNEQNHI